MTTEIEAKAALKEILWELPFDLSQPPHENPMDERTSFWVHKRSNVRSIHKALWELQQFFGIDPTQPDWVVKD